MKTLSKFIVILSLLAAPMAGYSLTTDPIKKESKTSANSGHAQVKLLPSSNGKIKVHYVHASEKKITVSISGENVSFSDKIRLEEAAKGFKKTYHFQDLPAGIYMIRVTDSKMSVSYEVEKLSNNTVWAKYWDAFLPEETPAEPIIASLNK